MKKTMLKSLVAYATILMPFGLYFSSCTTKTDSEKTAEKINEEKFDTRAGEKDAQFLVDIAVINMEEIQLGQLAQNKSTSKEVKNLGKMMENEHTRSLNELKALATKKGVSIPSETTPKIKETYDKMNEKRESEFNEEYCEMMVKGQKEVVDMVEKAATESEDNDIKSWAAENLPELKKHLDHAMTCQGNAKMESSLGK